jgi:Flp pilus assembly protein CpaB
MSAQPPRRQQQQRSGGGRALMLLGIVLALLSGVLVVYIVSNVTQTQTQTEQVVVVTTPISAGTVISLTLIGQDFAVKSYPASIAPAGAYIFTTQDALNAKLSQQVTTNNLYPGDVLLATDPRIAPIGQAAVGSLTSLNPGAIKPGEVLFPLQYSNPQSSTRGFAVAGDTVDVIVQECGTPWTTDGGCAVATTFQGLLVYATFNGYMIVVADPHDAEVLKLLAATGNVSLAIRRPEDTTSGPIQPVTPVTVAKQYFGA